MAWEVRTFLAQIMIEWRAKECHYGLVGILTDNDESDCIWRNYVPQLPIFELLLDSVANMEGSYIETACSNWYSAAWENFPITEEYLQSFDVERPSTSGDSNQERTEENDGDNVIDQIADEEEKRIDEEENEKVVIFWTTILSVQQRRFFRDWVSEVQKLTDKCFKVFSLTFLIERVATKFLVYF